MGWATLQQIDASVLPPGRTLTMRLASQALSQQSGLRIDTRSWAPGVDPLYLGYRTADRGDRGINQGCLGKVHLYSSPVTNSYDAQPSLYLAGLEREPATSPPVRCFEVPALSGKGGRLGGSPWPAPALHSGAHRFSQLAWGTLHSAPEQPSYDSSLSPPSAEGQAWYQEDAGLVMLNRGVDGTAAVVSVCRIGGPESPASCTAGIDFDCNGLAGPDDPACAAFQGAA